MTYLVGWINDSIVVGAAGVQSWVCEMKQILRYVCMGMSEKKRLTFLVLDNNVPDGTPGAGIDSCGGFIQHHQAGAPYEGDGDWQLALHAAWQGAHPLVSVSVHACLLQDPGGGVIEKHLTLSLC